MSSDKHCVVITGVSSGIGYALLEVFIAEGYFVFGSVRKQSDADRLITKYQGSYFPLLFDVVDEIAVRNSAEQVNLLHQL